MKWKEKEEKINKKNKNKNKQKPYNHIHCKKCYEDYLIEFVNAKALGLNSKNKIK